LAALGLALYLQPVRTFYTLDEIARVTDRDKRLVNEGDVCWRNWAGEISTPERSSDEDLRFVDIDEVRRATGESGAAPVLLWFRRDLRLRDNPSVVAAIRSGRQIIPVFILQSRAFAREPGAASLWWLDKSLKSLGSDLEAAGSRLVLRRGEVGAVLRELVADTGAELLIYSRVYEPQVLERDAALTSELASLGVATEVYNASLLLEPGQVRTGAGQPYSVFTPFWRAARPLIGPIELAPAPTSFKPPEVWPASDALIDWGLHPTAPDWSSDFADWTPGEAGAHARLHRLLDEAVAAYGDARDRPGVEGTSRLSPHLAWGEIGPRQVFAAVEALEARAPKLAGGADKFLAELGWREFNYNILLQHPRLATRNLKPAFDAFPWRRAPDQLDAWRKGQTGYPIVDAGMRQLWRTGWMHNRVRMIVASFLIKHLLIDWREGEAWFWDTLVDADPASNPGGWQWVAGSGADAAPFFRIFNPIAQGEKFDPDGLYVRRWVPELADLPAAAIHAPWTASPIELAAAGVRLGETYPAPIVDHAMARARALEAFKTLQG
jgi:deoxyribodipyrimidine photo-lyase